MFSRKRFLLALLLVVLFAVLIQLRAGRTKPYSGSFFGLDRALVSLYSPVLRVWDHTAGFVEDIWERYLYLVHLREENDQFKEEKGRLELENRLLRDRLKDATIDEQTRFLADLLDYEGVEASLVAFDPHTQSQTVWISAGTRKGIGQDDPVIGPEGLVGRVIRVFPKTSQVLLLTDLHFAVDVVDEETRGRGLVTGLGKDLTLSPFPFLSQIEYLGLGKDFRPGDLLVTSGLNEMYPVGIPVGRLAESPEGGVIPVEDFAKLERVRVLTRHRSDLGGRNPLLP